MYSFSPIRLMQGLASEPLLPAAGFDHSNGTRAAPKLVPYTGGPPVLSPWCSETRAAVTYAPKPRCPFVVAVTQSD
jgi:hypothetical protein